MGVIIKIPTLVQPVLQLSVMVNDVGMNEGCHANAVCWSFMYVMRWMHICSLLVLWCC